MNSQLIKLKGISLQESNPMKHKLFFLLFICTCIFTMTASSQSVFEDVVYLKNGSIIHGLIMEQIPNESLKIQTRDRSVYVFRMDEVMKIAREEIITGRRKRTPLTKDDIKHHGFTNITELSIGRDALNNGSASALAGYQTTDVTRSLGIQTVNGYMFNHYLMAGIGLAFITNSDLAFVPLFAEIRCNLAANPLAAFVFADAGYAFTAKEVYGMFSDRKYFGGTYFSPGMGIKFNVAKSKALTFSLGYRSQEARIFVIEYGGPPYYTETGNWKNYTIGFLNTKAGIIF